MTRFELKYQIARKHVESARSHLSVSGKFSKRYHVLSTYFDDWKKTAFNSKLDGEYQRTKIRVRSYSTNFQDSAPLYLEKKKRSGQLVSKERIQIDSGFFSEALKGSSHHPWLAGLIPLLTIYYFREEYVFDWGRITLDTDITFRWESFERKFPHAILEIKTDKAFNAQSFNWLHNISKVQSFSKYATGMAIKEGLIAE